MLRRLRKHLTLRDVNCGVRRRADPRLVRRCRRSTATSKRARVARAVSDIGTLSLQLYRWQQDTNALPASLAEAGLSGDDPWGRPYVYVRAADAGRAQLRKDGERVAAEHRFRSLQRGARRRVGAALPAAPSQDDVVRAADGAYIGLAVNY